ncbi:MAG: hypothetical protein EP343_14295 [Deltaproteobacteria bacterium]|nr:MAG: hypothetical protein EP343_14295 [Deltaproteobacteria bacterium]
MMSQAWIDFIIQNRIVGFFEEPVKLSSGRYSHWYINWRKIAEDVYLLDQATDLLLQSIQDQGWNPSVFYGVPEGASKLALLTQYKWARQSESYGPGSHVFSMGRGKPKEHGAAADRHFLGHPSGPTVVLEDVTTTGGSLLRTVRQLRESGVEIVAAVTLTDRMEPRMDGKHVSEHMKQEGIPYVAMSRATELLPAAIEHFSPAPYLVEAIKSELIDNHAASADQS